MPIVLARVSALIALAWIWVGSHKDHITSVIAILGVAGGLLSAGYAAVSYGVSVADARRTAAVAYLDKYRYGEIAKARRDHALFWLENSRLEMLEKLNAGNVTVPDARKMMLALVGDDDDLRSVVYELSRFYRDLSVCVLESQCDLRTACKTLGREVWGFYGLYIDFLERWGRLWKEDTAGDMKRFWWKCEAAGLAK